MGNGGITPRGGPELVACFLQRKREKSDREAVGQKERVGQVFPPSSRNVKKTKCST